MEEEGFEPDEIREGSLYDQIWEDYLPDMVTESEDLVYGLLTDLPDGYFFTRYGQEGDRNRPPMIFNAREPFDAWVANIDIESELLVSFGELNDLDAETVAGLLEHDLDMDQAEIEEAMGRG